MSVKENPIVVNHSATIDSQGGAVNLAHVGASVTVAPSSAPSMSVHLAGAQRQFDKVLRPNYAYAPHGVTLTVTPSEMADDSKLTVQLPVQGAYDPKRTFVGVMTQDGRLLSLDDEQPSADGTSVSGSLTKSMFTPLRIDEKSNAPLDLMAFTANPAPKTVAGKLISGAFLWDGTSFVPTATPLPGKRVAVCVHGIDAQLSNLDDLAQFLTTVTVGANRLYDAVIGFQYTSNVGLAIIGGAMAQAIYPLIGGSTSVDLVAHSMGNLVSRYAMETVALPHRLGPLIRRYVSLAGPHQGLPFADLSLIKALYLALSVPNEHRINDMLTYGGTDHTYTSFLTALNVKTNGPDYNTAHYYTLSGTNWQTYSEPWGLAVETLYVAADPFDNNQWVEDGLIANYSAQTKQLQKLSKSWTAGPKLPINQRQFVTDKLSFDQIKAILAAP